MIGPFRLGAIQGFPNALPPPPWLTIGLNVECRGIVMLGVSKARWEAQAKGIERLELASLDGMPCGIWEVFELNDRFGHKLQDWIIENGFERASAIEAVRAFGKVVLAMIDGFTHEHMIVASPRAKAISTIELVEAITRSQARASRRSANPFTCDACGKTFKTIAAKNQHWADKCGKSK